MGHDLVAYLALLAFPVVALAAFGRLPRAEATAFVVATGSIFLPERVSFDFPAAPPLDKEYVLYLSLLVAALVHRPAAIRSSRPGRGPEALVALMILSILGTAATNPEPLLDEGRLEPGLGGYWLLANAGDDLLTYALPFVLGRALIRDYRDLSVLLRTVAAAAAVYAFPIALEVLLSVPFRVFQLSHVVYGVPMRPQFRWGFTQPIVFMDNGLALATFMVGGVVAANVLVALRSRIFGYSASVVRAIAYGGLILTMNIAGNVYGLGLTGAFAVFRSRQLAAIAFALAGFAIAYPAIRTFDAFPYEDLVAFAAQFDPERARSLEGRFLEEEHVLGPIGDRFWFGWGNISRTPGAETFGVGEAGLDGWWTIQLGSRGFIGVLLHYAILFLPVMSGWRMMRRLKGRPERLMLAALMAIVSVRMIDLLINGWWNDLPVFLAGALYGVSRIRADRQSVGIAGIGRRSDVAMARQHA